MPVEVYGVPFFVAGVGFGIAGATELALTLFILAFLLFGARHIRRFAARLRLLGGAEVEITAEMEHDRRVGPEGVELDLVDPHASARTLSTPQSARDDDEAAPDE